MRVVIADDEKFVLVVLKSALRSVRFPIEIVGEALDGDDAYRLCCKKKPDLLITDICMPRKDGLDLLAKLRETQPELPVIIYSGFDNFSYAQKAIHYGVEEYLLKPIDEEKLERAISDVMQRRQMRSLRDKTQSRSRHKRARRLRPPSARARTPLPAPAFSGTSSKGGRRALRKARRRIQAPRHALRRSPCLLRD